MKILFTGGGTGGHIYPIVAVVRELKKKYGGNVKLSYLGPKDNFCKVVLAKEQVKVRTIMAGKMRRYGNPLSIAQNIIDMFIKIPFGVLQSFFLLFFINPDAVLSKGGYGSFPVAIAAWVLRIPLFLQESDIIAGLAVKKTARYATKIFVSFPNTQGFLAQKMILSGNPVRAEISNGSKDGAVKALGIKGGRPIILVIGGSQGAQRINDKILDAMPDLLKAYEIIHIVGPRNLDQLNKESRIMAQESDLEYYHSLGFANEKTMADVYAAADLIVSRAGSGSIFEIAAVKKPSILIPLPEAAQNHQVKNAYAYARTGAALVMEEGNFTRHLFLEKINDLFATPESTAAMAEAAAQFARPVAGETIADHVAKYVSQR
jgi:UDP-N-acetylglucosamine--N-acetylmuramyl-(pentapeptide) pyrophosphoryl-undecaprenol N-acetylglucosamine transferase